MKTKFIILGVLSAVILTACTNTNKETNQEKEQKERDKSRNPIRSIYRIPNVQNSSSVVIHT